MPTTPSCQKCLLAACALALAVLVPASAHAQSNPLARGGAADPATLNGAWNGANLERRSNCSSSQNDGSRGTYAEYVVTVNTSGGEIAIDETAITGLRCTYSGRYQQQPSGPSWSGFYTCSDGKRGTFQSRSFLVTPNEMSIRLAIKLDTTESCDIDAILGGSRF